MFAPTSDQKQTHGLEENERTAAAAAINEI
jgi:hypothetical protein